jgi:hypothetical protein
VPDAIAPPGARIRLAPVRARSGLIERLRRCADAAVRRPCPRFLNETIDALWPVGKGNVSHAASSYLWRMNGVRSCIHAFCAWLDRRERPASRADVGLQDLAPAPPQFGVKAPDVISTRVSIISGSAFGTPPAAADASGAHRIISESRTRVPNPDPSPSCDPRASQTPSPPGITKATHCRSIWSYGFPGYRKSGRL